MDPRQPPSERTSARTRRNDRCPCGSGRRYKHCCGFRPNAAELAGLTELGLAHLNANRIQAAVDALIQAIQLAPGIADNHYNLALALERIGRDGDAIGELRRTIAINPLHVAALDRIGNLLVKQSRRDEAVDCYQRVASLQPNSLMGRLSHAKMLAGGGSHSSAATLLDQTISMFPTSSEAKQLLATILREQGRFTEAIPLLTAATYGSPVQAAIAFHDLVLSKTITVVDAPILQRMHALLALDTLPEMYHPKLYFALGKALDDLGEYEEAIKYFDKGNRIVRRFQPFDSERCWIDMQRLTSIFTADFLEAHTGLGSSSEAPLLILGMPRSGTTLVEQIVSNHRDIAAGGELNFWNGKADAFTRVWHNRLTASRIAQMAEEYEAILRRVGPRAARVTDKSPNNFLWIGLIRVAFPKARIIHCRRHPVDTCLSTYFTSFGERMPFAHSKEDLVLYYQHYVRIMQHWRTILSHERFHEVEYEQLVGDPEPTTRRLIAFCGLDWDAACLQPEANHRPVATASLWQVRQPIYCSSVERWRHYEPWLGGLEQLLALTSPGHP